MKKIFSIFLCMVTLFTMIVPVCATSDNSNSGNTISYYEEQLDNGWIVVDEIVEYSHARSTEKTYERKKSFYDGDTLIAVIAFQATYRYTGTSVSVVSKTVTQTDTYSGWSFKQNSFTSSGGTVALEGTLKYLLIFNSSDFSMSMTCDKNGNITYA